MAVVIAIAGGRPGMISAATGAMALVMVTLVKEHGLQYLLAATLLTGVLQMGVGLLKLGRLMRFVSRSVVTGFVNALAILIFMAQLPELNERQLGGVRHDRARSVQYLRLTVHHQGGALPAGVYCGAHRGIHGNGAGHSHRRPHGATARQPARLFAARRTLEPAHAGDHLPYAATLAVVGLLESMMTASIVDELDRPPATKPGVRGQGIANIATGCIGGMAGCAMIGQSMINVKSGGRGRLSTFVAGVFLLILVVFQSPGSSKSPWLHW